MIKIIPELNKIVIILNKKQIIFLNSPKTLLTSIRVTTLRSIYFTHYVLIFYIEIGIIK